jgi:capsular exopolysaccharide synthesis family protein
MDLHLKSNGSGGSEALEPVELLPLEKSHRALYPHLAQEHSPILHYWRILQKRKWVILATFAIVFSLSAIGVLSETRIYQATSKVAIFPEVPNVLGFKDGIENNYPDFDYEAALETQVAILRSDALALKVIEAMRLYRDPRFTTVRQDLPEPSLPDSSMQPDPTQAASLLGAFHGGLSIQLIPSTRLILVSYTHPDPRFATEITNTLVKTFIEENFRTKYDSASQTSDWLNRELADLQLKVQTSEEKLVRYQKDHGILGVDEKQNIVTEKLGELNKELTEAEMDRIEKEADYRLAINGDPASLTRATPDGRNAGGLLDKLREKEADLETQYAMATTEFGSGYPRVSELSNQLKQVRAAISAEKTKMQEKMRDGYLAASQRESLLESAFNQQKQEANKLNESAIEYTVLKRDAETNRQLYQDLLQRLKEAGVSAGLRSSNIRIVDIARIPTQPISPNVHRSLVLGFLLGLSLAIGLALVLESFDNTVRSVDEVSTVSTLPALGTIPLQLANDGPFRKVTLTISTDAEESGKLALVTYERPKSQGAEAYRALRTSILLSSFGAPPKVILVTSAMPQEGKTTISANTALVLAQRGSRVLLVDADLRRPGVHKLFGLRSQAGLSTLISGSSQVEDAIVPCPEVPSLWILPAGPIPPQPAELLGSTVMRDYIARWRNEFDHIIIDTPPCLSVTDAVLLSPEADRVILVARSGQTTRPALRRACDLLLQVNARVMGIVLNALNLRTAEGYYYYGGRYSKAYYSEESADDKQTTTASKVS